MAKKGSSGWARLMARARDNTMFVCGLCEKPTPEEKVQMRQQPANAKRFPNLDPTDERNLHEWQCHHCSAWHPLNRTTPGEATPVIT